MPSTDFKPVTSKAETIRNLGGMADSHDAILQFLNRVIGDLYFPLESFTSTADQWNGIPIVFAKTHPDLKAFDDDRDRELQRIGGKIVGFINHAHIVTVGHPRLMGQMVFTDDGQCSQYILQGILSLSTGFWCRTNRKIFPATLVGNIRPNHVLVFVEDMRNQPRDQGSIILNKEERKYCGLGMEAVCPSCKTGEIVEGNEPIENKGKTLSAKYHSRFQKIMSKIQEVFGSHQEAIKDLEGVLGEMTAERSDVNGDYHSILPPTGATDTPAVSAMGKVGNDMLHDATSMPPVGGMGKTSMKQAETSANPPVEADRKASPDGKPVVPGGAVTKEEEIMDEVVKKGLEDMGFKYQDGAAFITQLKQLMEDKKALEERINSVTKELGDLKAQKQQAEFEAGKAEEEEKEEAEEEAEEGIEEKKNAGGIMGMFKTGKSKGSGQQAMKQKIEELTQKVNDMKFEQLVNKLPKGKAPKTDAERLALRKRYDEDGGPEEIMNMVIDSAKGFKPGTPQEGVSTPGMPAGGTLSIEEQIKNKKTRGIGTWDPYLNEGKGGYRD